MDAKQHEDKLEDTGIGSTFASKQDEYIADIVDQDNHKETSELTPKEAAAWIRTEVSPFDIISPEEPSLNLKEVEILPGYDTTFDHDADKTRPRTLTSKGREYQCELKKKAALAYDRDLRVKLRSLEEFIGNCKNPDKIRMEIAVMAKEVDEVVQSFDDWIDLSVATCERQRAANKQTYCMTPGKQFTLLLCKKLKDSKKILNLCTHESHTVHEPLLNRDPAKVHVERHYLPVVPKEQPFKKSLGSHQSLPNRRTN